MCTYMYINNINVTVTVCFYCVCLMVLAQEDDSAVAARMLQLSHQVNSLKERVEAEELDGRKSSVWIDASTLHDFPKLTEQQLREMTCGSYQLKLSRCYIKEHIDGNHDILIHREDRHLLKVKMQSRHVSSKAHILWISFNETEVNALTVTGS